MHKTDNWCWKPTEPPFNGKVCVSLDACDIMEWADAMHAAVTTKFLAPDTETFWNRKAKNLKSKRGKSEETTSYPPHQPVHIHLNERAHPQTPRPAPVSAFTISPVRGFASEQYNNNGLLTYVQYLADTLRDLSIMDVYPILNREQLGIHPILNQANLGIDLFKSSTATADGAKELVKDLKNDCHLTSGMARRLVENFQAWYRSLPERSEI